MSYRVCANCQYVINNRIYSDDACPMCNSIQMTDPLEDNRSWDDLYESQQINLDMTKNAKIIILYTKLGNPVSDFELDEFVSKLQSLADGQVLKISTENVIHEIRARIKEGKIASKDVSFIALGTDHKPIYLFPDKDGRLDQWPSGFCDTNENTLFRLIK